jgi:RHS repeat-associated protein
MFRYKFNTQELDSESGLHYYKARYYDPHIGRFISPDTIIPNPLRSQSFNRYSYTEGSPIEFRDISGHSPASAFFKSIGKFFKNKVWPVIRGLAYGIGGAVMGGLFGGGIGAIPGFINGFEGGYHNIYHGKKGFGAFVADSTWSLFNTTLSIGYRWHLGASGAKLNKRLSRETHSFVYTDVGDAIKAPGLTIGNTLAIREYAIPAMRFLSGTSGDKLDLFADYQMSLGTLTHELTHVMQYRALGSLGSLKLAQETIMGPYGAGTYDPYTTKNNLEYQARQNECWEEAALLIHAEVPTWAIPKILERFGDFKII